MPKSNETDPVIFARKVFDEIIARHDPESLTQDQEPSKNVHAQALGRLGGQKGGLARAKNLSAKKRSQIAKKAANARWQKKG